MRGNDVSIGQAEIYRSCKTSDAWFLHLPGPAEIQSHWLVYQDPTTVSPIVNLSLQTTWAEFADALGLVLVTGERTKRYVYGI